MIAWYGGMFLLTLLRVGLSLELELLLAMAADARLAMVAELVRFFGAGVLRTVLS
jgi:hypothetical protein